MRQFILSPKLYRKNIKWNLNHKCKKIFSLLINTRNANCLRENNYKSLEKIAVNIYKTYRKTKKR